MTRFNRTLFSASSEFVSLCQSQLVGLVQDLGAARGAVYLACEPKAGARELIPITSYPEVAPAREADRLPLLPAADGVDDDKLLPTTRLLTAARRSLPAATNTERERAATGPAADTDRQLVLPLLYKDAVLGILVVGREDRDWGDREFARLERTADTLALAGAMDQRRGHCEQTLQDLQRRQQRHGDRLDDLLHQLRNPLAALRTFGKLLVRRLDGAAPDAAARARNLSIAAAIGRESDRLQELFGQFGHYVDAMAQEAVSEGGASPAIDTGAPPALATIATEAMDPTDVEESEAVATYLLPGLTLVPVDVAAILSPLLSAAEAIAQERGISLKYNVPDCLPPARADARALREVISNILDNAVKYALDGGAVDVRAGLLPPNDVNFQGIAIGDDGPSIPTADQEHIFERRYRGVQSTGNIPGSGLGLAIAKELVDQMHGWIQLVSPTGTDAAGNPSGTTFIVWLPESRRDEGNPSVAP
ncbi:signal transduction histidine kinase [Rubidibacter lacunae KORDI 51-2]|uniref:histidine kinase n=1 Tax=Rubidibacter lacunae KORDI 51-2 TaxID=582515 RepID=U5DKY7_9CHRO|nr:HAMP domain-containing sensor histidine kinase [Rubidibacter lacunae]ERN40385.1 signal transduction histidine kinase [Rubidibacter lacunae KORDI 51-2]